MNSTDVGNGEFFALLRALSAFRESHLSEALSDRELAARVGVSPTTIGNWLAGRRFPQEPEKICQVVRIIAAQPAARRIAAVDKDIATLLETERWQDAYRQEARRRAGVVSDGVQGSQAVRSLAVSPLGRLLAEVTDPFDLEVHRPVQPARPQPGLPVLPTYVPREHDAHLADIVQAAARGSSAIAVLIGGSSAGKTRACWEALRVLRDQPDPWRLWHPIDPSRVDAALRELPAIEPRTVVWLNEAQFYLDASADGIGERVAAGLREALRDPGRAPVLVLATLWPQFWDRLTSRPSGGAADQHEQARQLLSGRDITVPAAFSDQQVKQIARAKDPRLAEAAAGSRDGQVVQFLAGVPELLARYRNAPPMAAALINAAMDARRLGMGIALPLAFLGAASPAYMSDADWDAVDDRWLEQALDYTSAPCRGVRGPLSPIRPRTAAALEVAFRLADYLDQHGRKARLGYVPQPGFWAAAADFASQSDLPALAKAAKDRGLLRTAAQLLKRAATSGDASAAAALVEMLYKLHPADHKPARWVSTRVALHNPEGMARLVKALLKAGAGDTIAAVLVRDPAGHVNLDNAYDVGYLLEALHEAESECQVAALASRAARMPLAHSKAVARLLRTLRRVGADGQADDLLARINDDARLRDPWFLSDLLVELARTSDGKVLARAASRATLDDPHAIARLLRLAGIAGAAEQAAELASRAVDAYSALNNPGLLTGLLDAMATQGTRRQAATIAANAAINACLRDPLAVAQLLTALKRVGNDHVGALLARDPASQVHLPANGPWVDSLFKALLEAEAYDQAATLAVRAPAKTLGRLDSLIRALKNTGAHEQATALAATAARTVPLDNPPLIARLLGAFREIAADEQAEGLAARVAAHAPVERPSLTTRLLTTLQRAGEVDQVAVLAGRAAADTPLDDPPAVAGLLGVLRRVGREDEASALARRSASEAPIERPHDVAWLIHAFRWADQEGLTATLLARDPASHVSLLDPDAVARLLDALRKSGATDQAAALAARAAATAQESSRRLTDALRRAGTHGQATALVKRTSASLSPDRSGQLAESLRELRGAGALKEADELAAWIAAHAQLTQTTGTSNLVAAVSEVGTGTHAQVLIDRLAAEGMFFMFLDQGNRKKTYGFGREPDGTPARPWSWNDLD